MEELYQDQEIIIQQLRLLLAAKDEELNASRGKLDSGGEGATGESVTDQLISELEEKKNEAIELHARMQDIETSGKEKLSGMADELDEKDKIIASLQSRLSGGHGEETPTDSGEKERVISDLEAARAAERGETERRLVAIEEQLEEKERLLGEARRELDRHATATQQVESAGRGDAGCGPSETVFTRSDLEGVVAERAQLQAELDQLRDEMDAVLKRDVGSRRRYEERIAELEQQIGSLQEHREDSTGDARETDEVGSPVSCAALAQELSADTPDSDRIDVRIRILEHNIEEKDLSYRTVQAQLHRLRTTQQMLRGVCAGLSVFLICVLSIKTKQPHTPRAEAASLPSPISLTGSTAGGNDDASPPREIPAHTAKEPERHQAEEDLIQMEPVVQAAAPGAAGKADGRIAYTVQKGDSLWLICKRMLGNGEAMARIARENNISDPHALKVGDVIHLSRK
jgi:hypothetical protein